MAIVTSNAIVLKKNDLRETSLLLDLYTEKSGKIKGVIKGIRSPMPQFGAVFEPFSLVKIVFYENKNKDIFIISQAELVEFFPGMRDSLEKLGYASYITELINVSTESGEKNTGLYELLVDAYKLLCGNYSPKRIARIFELKLLVQLGMTPAFTDCISCGKGIDPQHIAFSVKMGGCLCELCKGKDVRSIRLLPGTYNFIMKVLASPVAILSRVKVSQEVGRQLERVMKRFIEFHIGRRFKSMEFLRKADIT